MVQGGLSQLLRTCLGLSTGSDYKRVYLDLWEWSLDMWKAVFLSGVSSYTGLSIGTDFERVYVGITADFGRLEDGLWELGLELSRDVFGRRTET